MRHTPIQDERPHDTLDEAAISKLAGMVAKRDLEEGVPSSDKETGQQDSFRFEMHASDYSDSITGKGEEFLLVLNIKAKRGETFSGEKILKATRLAGMQFGEHNIFHRHAIVHDRVVKKPVCSLANMFEPGSFNMREFDLLQTSGLVMFMQLPGPLGAEEAFENTLRTAQKLALELDAQLCDDSHCILTAQTIGHLQEQMKAYDFRQRMQASKQHNNP